MVTQRRRRGFVDALIIENGVIRALSQEPRIGDEKPRDRIRNITRLSPLSRFRTRRREERIVRREVKRRCVLNVFCTAA
jgi:hypothetical protein